MIIAGMFEERRTLLKLLGHIVLQLVDQPITYWAAHLNTLSELNLCQSDVSQYVELRNAAVLLTSTWACFLLGGAHAADLVAPWPSGYSLVRRGDGTGEAL